MLGDLCDDQGTHWRRGLTKQQGVESWQAGVMAMRRKQKRGVKAGFCCLVQVGRGGNQGAGARRKSVRRWDNTRLLRGCPQCKQVLKHARQAPGTDWVLVTSEHHVAAVPLINNSLLACNST